MKNYKNISSFNAKKIIEENKENPNFEIIDVRTEQEYDQGHIKNATLYDIYKQDFQTKISQLDKNKKYLVYCRTGSRSRFACEFMISTGFLDVSNLENGFLDWSARNL